MKQSRPNNIVPLPDQPVSLSDVLAEIHSLRVLIEGFVIEPPPARQWLTAEEYAERTHRSVQAVRKACRVHKIGIQVGGRWRIPVSRK